MRSFSGKTALVTGAAGGMGAKFAFRLVKEGARVIITDLHADGMEIARDKAPKGPGEIIALLPADISTGEGCAELYRQCREIAPVDLLINNAGIINYGFFHEIPDRNWENLINVNLLAPMRLSHLFLPRMVERKQGHVAFMCSVAGFVATSLGTPYSTSKFGLRGFGMALAGELKDKGVKVTLVYPWWVDTPLLKAAEHGNARVPPLPRYLLDHPGYVARKALEGIKKEKLHVYPGPYSKGAWLLTKAFPLVSKQAH